MPILDASVLAPLVNSFSIQAGATRSIVIPKASSFAGLREVTVSGTLLKKQFVTLDPASGKRTVALGKNNGAYDINTQDGDLHFCLGTAQGTPHIACELQNAKDWLAEFNAAQGESVSVTGFFRCMFEHPGVRSNDDAHVFEIHPVRVVAFPAKTQPWDVGVPDQQSLHTWGTRLSQQDAKISVAYDKSKDTLTFSGMGDGDTNYVFGLQGRVSSIALNASSPDPASFTFDSPPIGHPVQVFCLKGTSAALQLAQLKGTTTTLTALRNVDLGAALQNRYVIDLLAIRLGP